MKPFEALSLRPLVANPADLGEEEDEVRSSGSRCILRCILCFFVRICRDETKTSKTAIVMTVMTICF